MNGKSGEWMKWSIALAVAALTSYFTAKQQIGERVTAIDTREQARWEEMQRRFDGLEGKVDVNAQRQEAMFQRVLDEWARGIDRRTGEPLPLQSYIDKQQRPR